MTEQAQYIYGQGSEFEYERLVRQGALYEAFTRRAFVNAGIAPGMFRFEVTAKGTGQLLIIDSFPCAGGPASGAMKACPYAAGAAGSSPEAGANLAIRPFSVTVQVT